MADLSTAETFRLTLTAAEFKVLTKSLAVTGGIAGAGKLRDEEIAASAALSKSLLERARGGLRERLARMDEKLAKLP